MFQLIVIEFESWYSPKLQYVRSELNPLGFLNNILPTDESNLAKKTSVKYHNSYYYAAKDQDPKKDDSWHFKVFFRKSFKKE